MLCIGRSTRLGVRIAILCAAFVPLLPAYALSQTPTTAPATQRTLVRGLKGADVLSLQQFLVAHGFLSSDSATSYFGVLTEAAVKKFQGKYAIVSSGTPATTGFGSVGRKTRAVIASLSTSTTTTPSPNSNAPCTFGTTKVADKSSITAYQAATAPFGQSCASQVRTCSNGVLSGSYAFASCSVAQPVYGGGGGGGGGGSSNNPCAFNGATVAHGASITAYQTATVAYGARCVSETRTCSNGTLSGSYTSAACSVSSAAPCTFNGASIQNGSSVQAFKSTSVTVGQTCEAETRTCQNGTLSGSYESSSCVAPTPISGALDMAVWMNTTKGYGYNKEYGEQWVDGAWIDAPVVPAQPFKMQADLSHGFIYYRKDAPWAGDTTSYDYYGELFSFDSDSVRLRTETSPHFDCTMANPVGNRCDADANLWDSRLDKFRLFINEDPTPTPNKSMRTSPGRYFAPRTTWNGWSHGPYTLNSYYCSSFAELTSSTCTFYQQGGADWVTITAYSNFDIFNAPGDTAVATPNGIPTQRIYDVVIVNQELNPTNMAATVSDEVPRGPARERFFFGRIGADYYGIVRWDLSVPDTATGKYKVIQRAISYGWDSTSDVTFAGMVERARQMY